MRRALLLLLVGLPALAQAAEDPVSHLISRLQGDTPIVADLQQLTDVVGGRPTGSRAYDQAVEWALGRFREAGLEAVRAEEFAVPHLWLPRVETAEVLAPVASPLRVAAMPLSASTPTGGLEAEVVDVGEGGPEELAAAATRLKGRFALVHSQPMKSIEGLFGEYLKTPPLLAALQEKGAAGVLWMSTRPQRLLYRHNATLDGSTFPLPGAVVEREGALRLARLLKAGPPVRVRLTSVADSAPGRSRNVVADLRGSVAPDEVVILGAHLDSWDLGRGALDNGCNSALVVDVARQMAALAKAGWRPRRTVRFVLYGGEEIGLLGSLGEVRSTRGGLDRVRAQVIFDEGTGRTTGFSLGGREDLRAAVEKALLPAAALGPFTHTPDAFVGTDNYDYLVEGVPNLVANQDPAPYLSDYHAESDTFDKADLVELKKNAAVAGALLAGLADATDLPGRQARPAIEALLTATGLVEQMRVFGLWEAFQRGERGRRP